MTTTADAPELTGFELVKHLGGGGFADVYQYEQRRPHRQVAIKVLKSTALSAEDKAGFDGEADLMARVSAHPFIVTIFDAGISVDGRPYLVMEYYRNQHLGVRAQLGMSVAEVLRTGVQVASAVETLHQSGIVHRDIKPANILVNEFRKPGLTDFGIAGVQNDDPDEESRGASIPYAPPEVVSGRSIGDTRADIYSLGATLYALLARRTPFEQGNPDRGELIQRILTAPPPGTDRPDVPRSLELLLQQALAKDPGQRPTSAQALALSLQSIERQLGYDPTPLEIRDLDEPDIASPEAAESDHDRTRAGSSAVVVTPRPDAQVPEQIASSPSVPLDTVAKAPPVAPAPEGATVARPATVVTPPPPPPPAFTAQAAAAPPTMARPPKVEAATMARPSTVGTDAVPPPDDAKRSRLPLLVAGVLVAAAAVTGVVVMSGGSGDPGQTVVEDEPSLDETDVISSGGTPDAPTAVRLRRDGARVLVTWTQAGDVRPDQFAITRYDTGGDVAFTTKQPFVLTGVKPGQPLCVSVESFVEATGRGSGASKSACL